MRVRDLRVGGGGSSVSQVVWLQRHLCVAAPAVTRCRNCGFVILSSLHRVSNQAAQSAPPTIVSAASISLPPHFSYLGKLDWSLSFSQHRVFRSSRVSLHSSLQDAIRSQEQPVSQAQLSRHFILFLVK